MKTKFLYEINIIRCFVIIFLVAYHSFAPFAGKWDLPIQYESTHNLYFWLASFFYNGMLETFVFISGYVYSLNITKHNYNFQQLFIAKAKRLYFPCLCFGVLFLIIFKSWDQILSMNSLKQTLNGIAHLWFLPMLLECFILEKLLIHKISYKKIWILLIIAVLPYPEIPLRINNSFYYILFFHLGYLFYQYKVHITNLIFKKEAQIPLLIIIYLVSFYFLTEIQIKYALNGKMLLNEKIIFSLLNSLCRISSSIQAVLLYFITGIILTRKKSNFKFYNLIANYSFGIYLFQEIILRIMYYKTPFCMYFTNTYYPWIGLIITFTTSFFLSYVFKKVPFIKKIL